VVLACGQKSTLTTLEQLPNYPDKNATAEFIINVTDVDNLNPKFNQPSYLIDIKEVSK
jgi:hypothetical protein